MRTGLITVVTDDRAFIVPAGQAIWLPPGLMHLSHGVSNICILSAFMEVDNWPHPPKACSVFQASELIEPLLKQVIAQQIRQRDIAIHEALFLLLKTEISDCRKLGPMPRDPRLWRDHSGTHNLKPEERACATGQYHPYDDEALQE